jgi:glycosyltransferase involved in cell wall biosynthesis
VLQYANPHSGFIRNLDRLQHLLSRYDSLNGVLRLKILHLSDSLNPAGLGGIESYLYYLCAELRKNGHDPFVATQSPTRTAPPTIKSEHYCLFHLPGNYLEARKWDLFEYPEEQRAKVVDQLFKPQDLEANVELLVDQLASLIQTTRPDLIHAHSTYVVFNRVLDVLKKNSTLKNTPLLVTIHGFPKPLILPNGTKTTDYDQFVSACPFDKILGVSKSVVSVLRKYLFTKWNRNLVETHYNGIDTNVFAPKSGVSKEWDLAYFGRLIKMKAIDLFPTMLSRLAPDFPNLHLAITGEGPYKQKLFAAFEREGVSNMVEYLGVVDWTKVPEILNRSRIFLYPSREEPFGISLIEAMACEVPVITTNVYGPKEIVTHGHDGLTVPPDDVAALTEAVVKLLSNEPLRMQMGKNARKTVEQKFSIDHHAEHLIEIYKELVQERR